MRDIRILGSRQETAIRVSRGGSEMRSVHDTGPSVTEIEGKETVQVASRDGTQIRVARDNSELRSLHTKGATISKADQHENSVDATINERYVLKERVGGVAVPSPAFHGFGFQRFSDTRYSVSDPLLVRQQVRTRIPNNAMTAIDEVESPFDGHLFVQNGEIVPSSSSDVFLVRLSFHISSVLKRNNLVVELQVNGGSVVQDHGQDFARSSGDDDLITINFIIYANQDFYSNRAAFYITTTRDAFIWGSSIVVTPISQGD